MFSRCKRFVLPLGFANPCGSSPIFAFILLLIIRINIWVTWLIQLIKPSFPQSIAPVFFEHGFHGYIKCYRQHSPILLLLLYQRTDSIYFVNSDVFMATLYMCVTRDRDLAKIYPSHILRLSHVAFFMSSYRVSGRMNRIKVNVEVDRQKELQRKRFCTNPSFGDSPRLSNCSRRNKTIVLSNKTESKHDASLFSRNHYGNCCERIKSFRVSLQQ